MLRIEEGGIIFRAFGLEIVTSSVFVTLPMFYYAVQRQARHQISRVF